MEVVGKIDTIVINTNKEIKAFSKERKSHDQYIQEIEVQVYMIETMIENIRQEFYFHLGGKYRDAMLDEMNTLKEKIINVNYRLS